MRETSVWRSYFCALQFCLRWVRACGPVRANKAQQDLCMNQSAIRSLGLDQVSHLANTQDLVVGCY